MKGKYYTFIAGDQVPTWMFGYSKPQSPREHQVHNEHHGKVVFGVSCIVVRGDYSTMSKIMPAGNNLSEPCIIVKGYRHAVLGGVAGATGVCVPGHGQTVYGLNASRHR